MSGSVAGGRKARDTNLARHGKDFYRELGAKGGAKTGIAKGFALMTRAQHHAASVKGGSNSRRGKGKKVEQA